jgi:hypothetical protein
MLDMSMLRIARSALLISACVYILALAAGLAGLIEPVLSMFLGAYAAIALGVAAAACVIAQVIGLFRRRG